MWFAAKAQIVDPSAPVFELVAAKTMYGGKTIKVGDVIFIFNSENEGGSGLIARGSVTKVVRVPKLVGLARQTPRISIVVERAAMAKRPLGRAQLKDFRNWTDGTAESELNFKFYRQATNKIVGISGTAAQFLNSFF